MEKIKVESYKGFGSRAVYKFEDSDGEVLLFEMNGMSKDEARIIKDRWLSEKSANKDEYEKTWKIYEKAFDTIKELPAGEGVILKTNGFIFMNPLRKNKYSKHNGAIYCVMFKNNEDFPFGIERYGETVNECIDKIQTHLNEFNDNVFKVKKENFKIIGE